MSDEFIEKRSLTGGGGEWQQRATISNFPAAVVSNFELQTYLRPRRAAPLPTGRGEDSSSSSSF
jgi:hypothetical protein